MRDIDDADKPAIQSDDAAQEEPGRLGGDLRRGLDLFFTGGEDIGNAVHQQAHDLAAELDDDDGVTRRRLGPGKAQPHREIDDRQDDAPQIDDAEHEIRGVRKRRRRRLTPDLPHRGDSEAEFLGPDIEGDQLIAFAGPDLCTIAHVGAHALLN